MNDYVKFYFVRPQKLLRYNLSEADISFLLRVLSCVRIVKKRINVALVSDVRKNEPCYKSLHCDVNIHSQMNISPK